VVEISFEGDWAVVRLTGDIDMATAPAISECLADLQRAGYRKLRVDLARVAFMDARGLNMLAGACKSADDVGGTIEAVNAASQVRKAFMLTGLDRLLAHSPSLARDAAAAWTLEDAHALVRDVPTGHECAIIEMTTVVGSAGEIESGRN
jgi:anti-anti-sigma factor